MPLSSGFRLVSSKKVKGANGFGGLRFFRLPKLKLKYPPKGFFIGVAVMSALIIAARILEFAVSR
jgi:hypothetical protein